MARIIDDDEGIKNAVRGMRRVAVLGIKPADRRDQPAFYVPEYLMAKGIEVIPVPVYYPQVTSILGRDVYRTLASIPGQVDMVDVFRRSEDIAPHLDDILAKKPAVVWFQLGIRNDEVAGKLVAAGIDVVQDRCLMVEHRRFG